MIRAGEFLTRLRGLPIVQLDEVMPAGKIMILAPHPDDETLGCGGLIAEACRQGRSPIVIVLSDGSMSHPHSVSYPPQRLAKLRAVEVARAVAILGLPAGNLRCLELPDTQVPAAGRDFDATVARLAEMISREGCAAIIAPWQCDPHCDHEAASLIGQAVAKLTGTRLWSYAVWGWLLADDMELDTTAPGGWRLDIGRHLDIKKNALAAHASQYTDLIADDPTGFRLPAALLRIIEQPYEAFFDPS